MNLGIDDTFTLYMLVFLAAVLAAWFSATWVQRRTLQKHRDTIVCRCCNGRIETGSALRHVRCPHCGARNPLQTTS